MGGVSDSISSSWVRRFIMLARIPRLSLAGFLSPYLAHMYCLLTSTGCTCHGRFLWHVTY